MGVGGAIGRRCPHPHTGELDADQRSQIGQHLGQLRGDAEALQAHPQRLHHAKQQRGKIAADGRPLAELVGGKGHKAGPGGHIIDKHIGGAEAHDSASHAGKNAPQKHRTHSQAVDIDAQRGHGGGVFAHGTNPQAPCGSMQQILHDRHRQQTQIDAGWVAAEHGARYGDAGEQGNIHGLKALHPRGDAGGVPQGAHQHIGKARAEEVEADADYDLLAVAVNGQHPEDQRQKCTGGAAAQQPYPRAARIVRAHGGEKPAEEHGALNADVDDTRPLADGAGQSAQCNGCGQPDGRGKKVGK